MNDQPNRPAFRMTETSFPEIEALMKSMFLDGLVQGLPLAKNVQYAIEQAVMFGRDEAMRSDNLPWSASFANFDELKAEATVVMMDGMFGGDGIAKTLHRVMMMGIAYGFQNEKHKMKYAPVEATLAKLVAEHAAGSVADETADAFFGELMKVEKVEVVVEYVRKVLTELKIPMSPGKLPNFKLFVDRYSCVLLDAPLLKA